MMTHSKQQHSLKYVGITLVLMLLIIIFLGSGCQSGQTPKKIYRVGILSGISFIADITDGFKAGMAELGYVEGENIIYDVQETGFDIPTYQTILQKFIEDKVDLILVFPTEASLEAKMIAEGSGIPVVFTYAAIEGIGLVNSVREPGGNITGVRYPGPDIALRRFEILHDLVPNATRILLPYQKGYPIVQPQLDVLYPAAAAAGVTLIEMPADTPSELEELLQTQIESDGAPIDAILLLVEPLITSPEGLSVITIFAAEQGIPIGGAYFAEEGYRPFFGVNVDSIDSGRLAAPLADKIFQGIPAGTIPVISAEMTLQIDYRMAQELGITVPESLLVLADEVFR